MRVLITTFPGKGHFHPVAPLGLALQAAGHDVRVATDADFGIWVEACGLAVMSAGRSASDLEAEVQRVPAPDRVAELFTTLSVPPLTADVLSQARTWRPDLVINEEGEHAGPLVAAVLGVPAVTHSWPAPARPGEESAARVDRLRPVWRDFGQKREPRLYGKQYLDCCPPPLQTSAIQDIPGVIQVRPTLFDGPARDSFAPLEDFARPLVFVTLGTVPRFCRPETLRLIAEAAAAVAGTVIVATGPAHPAAVQMEANVRTVAYAPLSLVLPEADVVVSHGGAGTLLACLLSGVPHLAIPQGAPSQERAADSVTALGLGSALRPPVEVSTVRDAVSRLLADTAIRPRLRSIATTVEALPGPSEVSRLLTDSK